MKAAETKSFEKVTVVFKSEFMGLSTIHCKTLRLAWGPYAQYRRATELRWRKPRQRKDRGVVKAYDQTMVVLEGFVEPYDNFTAPEAGHTPGVMVQRSKFMSADPAWGDELLNYARECGARILYAQGKRGEALELETKPAAPADELGQMELAL